MWYILEAYYLVEAINALKERADDEEKPYLISDGAFDWDPYDLVEAIMEGIIEEDDADDYDDEYAENSYYDHLYVVDRDGDSFAVFDVRNDGCVNDTPRYKVVWV